MTDNPFRKLVPLAVFGAMQNPPRGERAIRRWIDQPDGLPYVDTPAGKRIDVDLAFEYFRKRVLQAAPRRQGRAA